MKKFFVAASFLSGLEVAGYGEHNAFPQKTQSTW